MTDDFFTKKNLPSELKHQIVNAYLGMFVGKTGAKSRDGRVGYVDGFAGPGLYEDKSQGSPMLAADVADLLARTRELVGYFVEEDRGRADDLRANLASAGHADWAVWNAKVEDALPEVLAQIGDEPLLVFLDPYGLAIPFDMLIQEVMSRHHTTEVLLHFPHKGLARLAGHLRPQWWLDAQENREAVAAERGGEHRVRALERQRDTILSRLDQFLGDGRWRDYALSGHAGWQRDVLHGYIELVRNRAGQDWATYLTPVPNRYGGNPVYEMVLFTRHPHGLWEFNDATARAYQWLHESDWQKPGTLFAEVGAPDPRPEYIKRLKANFLEVLRQGRHGFKVADHSYLFLDDSLIGRAGKSEVRRALQQLHDEGAIGGDRPKSDGLAYYQVVRGWNAPQ